ncbi:unnamed protein product [Caenorhabditis nigoni]
MTAASPPKKRKMRLSKSNKAKRRKQLNIDPTKDRRSVEYFMEIKEKMAARDAAKAQKSKMSEVGGASEGNADKTQEAPVEILGLEYDYEMDVEPVGIEDLDNPTYPEMGDSFKVHMPSESALLAAPAEYPMEHETSKKSGNLGDSMNFIDADKSVMNEGSISNTKKIRSDKLESDTAETSQMDQSTGFKSPKILVQETELDSTLHFNKEPQSKGLAVKIDEVLKVPIIQKPVPMKAANKNSKNQISESQLEKLLKGSIPPKNIKTPGSADICPGNMKPNEKDVQDQNTSKAMDIQTSEVQIDKNQKKPESVGILESDSPNKLKKDQETGFKYPHISIKAKESDPSIFFNAKPQSNDPAGKVAEAQKIPSQESVPKEAAIANQNCKPQNSESEIEKLLEDEAVDLDYVKHDKKAVREDINTKAMEAGIREVPNNKGKPEIIDSQPSQPILNLLKSVPKIWANFKDLDDPEDEPMMPKTPEKACNAKKPEETSESGGGLDDYIKFMRELKNNPPPPKNPKVGKPQNATSTSSSKKPTTEVIKYRFDEADLIKKPMNLKDRKSDFTYSGERYVEDEQSMSADVYNVKNLLRNLNFCVEVAENLSAQQIESTIATFATKSHGDSAALFFITHGDTKGIYGRDGKVFDLDRVFTLLGPSNCPQLAEKPKLIFAENCRGERCDAGYPIVEKPGEQQMQERSGGPAETSGETTRIIPMQQDFLVCYSTCQGNLSLADARYGSYHIQLLCRTISHNAHRHDLAKILESVRNGMSRMDFRGNGLLKKQMPELRSTLTKAYYFNIPRKTEKSKSGH